MSMAHLRSRLTSGSLDSNTLPVNPIFADPTVDPASVVTDLESLSLNRLYQVQILKSIHLAQNNVADLEILGFGWNHRAKLARVDFAGHRVSSRPKLDRFTTSQFVDV